MRGWAVLLLNRVHYSSVVLSSFAFGLFLPFIQADLNLSYLEIGVLQGVWWATSALFLVPFSVLLGRFGPDRRVLAALALLTPLVFTQGLAFGFWTLLASRFFTVLTHASMASARPLLLRRWAAQPQYSTITSAGLSVHSACMAAVLTFSPLIIIALTSWRLAYFLQGGLLALQLLMWAALTWRAPDTSDEPASRANSSADSERGNSPAEPATPLLETLRTYPQAWLLGLIMLCLSATWTTVLTFLPTILENERAVPITGGSILFGFLYYALVPGALAGGLIFRRITNRKLMVLIPATANTVLTFIALLADGFAVAAIALTGIGLVWVFVPAMDVLPFDFPGITARQVSNIAALVLTFSAIGFGSGPLVAGAIAQITGSLPAGVYAVAAMTGVAIIAAASFPRDPSASPSVG